MDQSQFEAELRTLLRSEPFRPFTVDVDDGRAIFVDQPAIAFGGGRAGFIGPTGEIEFFDCEHVVQFRPAQEEPAR